MPPRQKTTFDKKGKGTTTYRDYNPAQERANAQLERFIRDNPEGDKRNMEASPIQDVVRDMPAKFQDNFEGITKYEDMNQQQKALFGFYDNRNKYQRDMNNLRTSSPEMKQAYAKRFPVSNFMMETAPRFMPVVGPLFTADRGMKANAEKEGIMNTPVNRPDGGFKNFVDFFAKGMTPDQAKNTEIISGESLRLAPQDIFNKSEPMTEKQKMDFMPGGPEINIFDEEKAAIDEALTPGDVFDPVAADKQSKVDFINQVENTNMTVEDAERSFGSYGKTIDDMFERAKQKQGMLIRDEVEIEESEEAPIGGQFDLTDQGTINLTGAPDQTTEGVREQIDMNTADPNLDIFTNQAFMGAGPSFPAGGVSSNKQVDPGLDMVGNKAFASEGGSQEALDILNSNADPYFSGYPTMRFNEGGSTNKYENMSTHEKLMRMASEMYG